MSGPACEHCGFSHLNQSECRYDLHGEEDVFKTSCATCRQEIPSGAPREADKYGNLYCSHECEAMGLEALLEAAEEAGLR